MNDPLDQILDLLFDLDARQELELLRAARQIVAGTRNVRQTRVLRLVPKNCQQERERAEVAASARP